MPHGQFTNISLTGDGRIHIEGKSLHHESPAPPKLIALAVIAIDNNEKRVDCPATTTGGKWSGFAPVDTEHHGSFTAGEEVLVLAGATHDGHAEDVPNPFVWHAYYRIGAKGSRNPPELTVVVDC